MKISSLGEFGLIEKIRKLVIRRSSAVMVGIGDDAAALKVSASSLLLASTDMLIEGVHFNLAYTDFYSLGWKSAAVNLSDIAAMGGVPRFCLTSLGIPPAFSVEQISDFYRGFNAMLRAHRTILVGGDTCSSRNGLMVSVTVLGGVEKAHVLTRAGAKPGDRIFVTGNLGDSAAGLEILKFGAKRRGSIRTTAVAKRLIDAHLRPAPRLEWGRTIALSRCARAMIDISDGLSSDLGHICEQSGVGAVIEAAKLPLSLSLRKAAAYLVNTPVYYALSGGEDYELLFTAPPEKIRKLRSLGVPLHEIGEITRNRAMMILDHNGKQTSLRATGYDHFAKEPRETHS
ncbi:MAG TPA: thiamine-phosphate kinase [Nitrospirota bacterium]|nr:thiamine-phosphate kinase [Nitrospirota bacterium]